VKTLVQCDFDGTITDKDVSFLLLDAFADGDWRKLLSRYQAGEMSVGAFNTQAFAMVKADKQTMLDLIFASGKIKVRPGFPELVNYCSQNGLKFVIVSNGQDFYIKDILEKLGLTYVEFHSAQSHFRPEGLEVRYIGPDGSIVEDSFKETYTRLFLNQGYRIIYAGNGISDIYPAKLAHRVFATDELLDKCRSTRIDCIPFNDLNDIVRGLEDLKRE
jgi:2-hydroxy-3-keto-5-methylthiopentenyl-1-phosphate phosphatase